MNNLIQKAIEAIKEGKNDFALGLLEGALAMSGETTKPFIAGNTRSVSIPVKGVDTPNRPEEVDPILNLDKMAAAKLASVKQLAQQSQ